MSLNKFMHPRNPYKERKPDFKALAIKYPEFRKHATQDIKGAVHIDFKKPECLRALSWALLKDDYDLDVEMPLDRLIPTIPLRLNYILWIEDLLSSTDKKQGIKGIDIGCGASCVYPLLGTKKNGWTFLTSEADSMNYQFAKRNVERNSQQEQITVVEVKDDTGLLELLNEREEAFDFVMCNPPFFGSNLEAWATYSTRNDDRPEPMSVCTASPKESVVPGGEVNFVKRMITDSLLLKDKIRIYTAMLGKKSSLAPLKAELQNQSIPNIGTTEFSQGRTMRWGIGWSFDTSIKFPVPPTKLVKKKEKPVQPLVHVIPNAIPCEYTVSAIGSRIMAMLDEFKIVFEPEKATGDLLLMQVVAPENTWIHQRRQRREKRKLETCKNDDKTKTDGGENLTSHTDNHCANDEVSVKNAESEIEKEEPETKRRPLDLQFDDRCSKNKGHDDKTEVESKHSSADMKSQNDIKGNIMENPVKQAADAKNLNISVEDVEEYVVKCTLTVRKVDDNIRLEMLWIDGQSKELLHQLMQVFKNRLI